MKLYRLKYTALPIDAISVFVILGVFHRLNYSLKYQLDVGHTVTYDVVSLIVFNWSQKLWKRFIQRSFTFIFYFLQAKAFSVFYCCDERFLHLHCVDVHISR